MKKCSCFVNFLCSKKYEIVMQNKISTQILFCIICMYIPSPLYTLSSEFFINKTTVFAKMYFKICIKPEFKICACNGEYIYFNFIICFILVICRFNIYNLIFIIQVICTLFFIKIFRIC